MLGFGRVFLVFGRFVLGFSWFLLVCVRVFLVFATVETYDKKLHFSVRESGNFLFLGWLYIQFWTGNPIFRSKLVNSGVQRSKFEGLDFLS